MKYGYIVEDGKIISKHAWDVDAIIELKAGQEMVEVEDHAVLDAFDVFIDPEVLKEAADTAKIAAAIEKLAIDEVKKTGVFESEKYKDK